MLLDLSSIKNDIASIKQTLTGIGSEGYYKAPLSLTDAYKVGELPAFSTTINASNGASTARNMGGWYTFSPDKAFYPKLNGVLKVKVTKPKTYFLLLPYTQLLTSNNWNSLSSNIALNAPDYLYWFNMDGKSAGSYEQQDYNSTVYKIFTSIRSMMQQDYNEFLIPCIKGLPLIPALYGIETASAGATIGIPVGFDKVEFFAQEIKS